MAIKLLDSEWRLVELSGTAVPKGLDSVARFTSDGKVKGSGGCNRFSGAYSLKGDTIKIGPLISTRRACPKPTTDLDLRFFRAIGSAVKADRKSAELSLLDSIGKVVARCDQTDANYTSLMGGAVWLQFVPRRTIFE